MSTWPPTLPQYPDTNSYGYQEKDNVLRSEMGYGPDKTRERTTATVKNITLTFVIEQALIVTLDNFYETNKAIAWDWIDHRNGNAANYKFKAAPAMTPWNNSGLNWLITLQLEIIP